jgi:RecA/RadA recombinase
MLEGVEEPPILIEGLLYDGTCYADGAMEGAVHTWYGEPGTGKSLIALWACIQVMRGGENALYIDEEGTKRLITERLHGLGAEPELIEERFYYYSRPQLATSDEHLEQLTDAAQAIRPGIVIFDSWIDFLANDGRSENSSDEVTQWAARMTKPLMNVGASVVILDHVPKDGSGRGARGSGGKLGWIAAGHKVTVKSVFNRHTVGEVQFRVEKDREAALPSVVKFAIGGNGEGRIVCEPDTKVIEVLDEDGLAPTTRSVLDALLTDGLRFNAWFKGSGIGSKETFSKHVGKLTAAGKVKHEGTLYIPVTNGTAVRSRYGTLDSKADQYGTVSPPMGETDVPPVPDQQDRPVDELAQQRERLAQARSVVEDIIANGPPPADKLALVDEATRRAKLPQKIVQSVVMAMLKTNEIDPYTAFVGHPDDEF